MRGLGKRIVPISRYRDGLLAAPSKHGIDRDIRGFLPGSSVPRFLHWFFRQSEREGDIECLRRELKEEVAEVALSSSSAVPESLSFAYIRQVIEPPRPAQGTEYWQMRVFRVFDLVADSVPAIRFRDGLVQAASSHRHLLLATPEEIRVGRCHGRLIGHHAGYLLTDRRVRPNEPIFDR